MSIVGFILGGLILYVLGYFINFPVGGNFLHTTLNFCIFYTSLYLLGYLFIQKQYFRNYQFALSLIIVGLLGFILTYFLKGGNQFFILPASTFPVSLPYVLASLFGIGLLLVTWNLWKKFSSINGRAIIKFLTFAGQNAIYFYIAQGISSSFLLKIAPKIQIFWIPKLALCFCINFILCVLCVAVLKIFFGYLETFLQKLR